MSTINNNVPFNRSGQLLRLLLAFLSLSESDGREQEFGPDLKGGWRWGWCF